MKLDSQWPYLELVASRRIKSNRTARHVESPTYVGENNSVEFEVLGAAGELAARRILGLPEILHEGFDGGADLIYRGIRIDVKATKLTKNLAHRFLQWPARKAIHTDVVLMTAVNLKSRKAVVVGYATRKEVLDAPVNQQRETPCHEIPISKLHPIWELEVSDIPRNCE